MEKIIPGGYYTYDSANKKIWLDYSFYNVSVENIDTIKNLTLNKIIYSAKNPQYPITVSNGCITHTYPSAGANGDKIQIVLKTPILDSLTELTPTDGVVTLETTGKVLVLPTENAALLPSFNEYVLNSNRLTIAESPFGGLKGSGSPDYSVGTLNVISGDGIYLQDVNGQNSTKTLTAGKLKELGYLTVDTTTHSITEEFIIANTTESNSPTMIDACDATTGWSMAYGTGTISIENGRIKVVGVADSNGYLYIKKILSLNLAAYHTLNYKIESSLPACAYALFYSGSYYMGWYNKSTWLILANTNTTIIGALKAPAALATTGIANPTSRNDSFNIAGVTQIHIGITGVAAGANVTLYLDNITADTAKTAYIELQTPNHLSTTSTIVQCWGGSAYAECRRDSLDGAYTNVSSTPANMKMLDGTKFDDVYGANLGRAYFSKGTSGDTKAGSSGNITYSSNQGTRNRTGFRIDLPPSDGGRTNFNKVRLKVITYYAASSGNYSASYDFADSTNASYGLQNLSLPWIALYDPVGSTIDFYRFTVRPQNISIKRNENGVIHELNLYPGTGKVYHGQIAYTGLTTDTDSDLIPDGLDSDILGSVTKFLENYTMET